MLLLTERDEPLALPRTAGWRSGAVTATGAVLPVVVSIGPMAAQLGSALVLVWALAAVIGAAQCVLLAELAQRFPGRVGGTAMYARAALPSRWRWLGALSAWGYWLAWTPGIAVNLMLAAGYLQAGLGFHLPKVEIAAAIAAALYALSACGLRFSVRIAAALAPLAAVPLLAIGAGALLLPGGLHLAALSLPPHHSATGLLVIKWLFVAVWSAYGAEMASTVVAELRDPKRDAPRALAVGATIGLVGFAGLPALLIALTGPKALAGDPAVALLPAAHAVYGQAGSTVIALLLAAALIAGAQAYIIGSSRTVFQMSRDGLLPRWLGFVNQRGAPVGGIVMDASLIAFLLAVFGTNALSLIAAANVGYLAVMVILPTGYLAARQRPTGTTAARKLGSHAKAALAAGLCAANLVLLITGAVAWGPGIGLIGAGLLICPIIAVEGARRRLAVSARARPGARQAVDP